MIEIKKASTLGEPIKKELSKLFVEGFAEHFIFFSPDKKILTAAFEHMFITDVFYVAIIDGEVAGMIACVDASTEWTNSSVKMNRKELLKHFGIYKGLIASFALKSEFDKPPMEVGARKASVEFVVTASKFRGQGVATAIMNHLFSFSQYDEYILEAADTNTPAIKLYEKLGYKEFKRIKQKHSKQSGINYLMYMKYIK